MFHGVEDKPFTARPSCAGTGALKSSQPAEPLSPEETNEVCPWAAACSQSAVLVDGALCRQQQTGLNRRVGGGVKIHRGPGSHRTRNFHIEKGLHFRPIPMIHRSAWSRVETVDDDVERANR